MAANSLSVCPETPKTEGATALAPEQGDHVFGDIIGVVKGAIDDVRRHDKWNRPTLNNRDSIASFVKRCEHLYSMDMGHHSVQENPMTQRTGPAELDEHSHMFGRRAEIVRWHIVNIMEEGFTFYRYAKLRSEFDELIGVLIDETALEHYLKRRKEVRIANYSTVRHKAISVDCALKMLESAPQNREKETIRSIIARIEHFKWGFLQIIKNDYYYTMTDKKI
ncbi:hypothetical protein [Brucella oryzae]